MRFAFLLLPAMMAAEDLRIGVLGLFHPREAHIFAARMRVDGESISLGGAVIASVDGTRLLLRTGTRVHRAKTASFEELRTIEIPGRIKRSYSGAVEVHVQNKELALTLVTEVERAVAISVSSEAPHAPPEAERAQAILARSYYKASPRRHLGFDFCDSTHCQLFQNPPSAQALAAAAATQGLILRFRGRPIDAMFFRNCGGATSSAAAVRLSSDAFPYAAVRCEACTREPVRWKVRLPLPDAAPLLNGERSEKLRLELSRRFGWRSIRSNSFQAHREGDTVWIEGAGEGHGVGVCQRGAAWMAEHGSPFAAILRHYLPDVEIGRF
ncbi:MAG: hypothetical protein JNL98_25125 [Bryobacterales bacterium]|nr:hypothetical protein [Bryobacterales bacterium]